MEAVAHEIAERLRAAPSVRIVTHIDTDGITGGAIASESLDRAEISHEVAFVKTLDEAVIADIKRHGTPLAWFVDLGAGMLHALQGLDAVVTDHHVPTAREVPRALRGDLIRFAESQDRVLMLNPHLEGEGSDVASGAGCAYAVAKALDPKNTDLAAIAIVGAVGDVQDQEFRRLSGYNRTILEDGIAAGVVAAEIDLRLFGRETRPAYKILQYATDPWIPRLSGNEEACIAFLLELGIDLKTEEHWRSWSDLDRGEKRRVVSALAGHMLERGCGIKEVERLVGETYTLVREPAGSPTRDAKEFGTLMNACGRYDEPVVGIAASLALNQQGATKDLPIIAFAKADDGIKVSARTTRDLVARGLDLAAVMQEASRAVGGHGGGHHAAAGATIPPGTEEKFLEIANRMVREQLGPDSAAGRRNL